MGPTPQNLFLITPFRSLGPLSMSKTPGSETNIFGQTPQKPILMITFKSLSPRARGGDLGGRQIPPPQSRSSGFRLRGRHPNFRKFSVTAPSAPQKFPFLGLFPRVLGGAKSIPPPPLSSDSAPSHSESRQNLGLPPIAKICDKKAILATPLTPKNPLFQKIFPSQQFAILASTDLDQTPQNLF